MLKPHFIEILQFETLDSIRKTILLWNDIRRLMSHNHLPSHWPIVACFHYHFFSDQLLYFLHCCLFYFMTVFVQWCFCFSWKLTRHSIWLVIPSIHLIRTIQATFFFIIGSLIWCVHHLFAVALLVLSSIACFESQKTILPNLVGALPHGTCGLLSLHYLPLYSCCWVLYIIVNRKQKKTYKYVYKVRAGNLSCDFFARSFHACSRIFFSTSRSVYSP